MASKIFSAALVGLEGHTVEVEADILGSGLPNFTLVGLPDAAVKEARNRVESALKNTGFKPPYTSGRVTVNLAPAHIPKVGALYDLPIALVFLLASKQIQFDAEKKLFAGELSLDGRLRSIRGALSLALLAREQGFTEVFLPRVNAQEAALVRGVTVFGAETLEEITKHLSGETLLTPEEPYNLEDNHKEEVYTHDMADVRGQEQAKRALEIAASGGHNILLSGSPGSGKTLLAQVFPSILPKLSPEESLEVTKIFSISGELSEEESIITTRSFRSPHHSASAVALVGGGSNPKPGEVTLAHRGVLFLDEFPEFSRQVLENLRQPLEEGKITISRAKETIQFPASFTLIAAMNPCPCGNYGDTEKMCSCNMQRVQNYQRKISGPLLDRIDLQIEVPRVAVEKFDEEESSESSASIKSRVEKARDWQQKRFSKKSYVTNSEMSTKDISEFCTLDESSKELLKKAISSYGLSARGYYRVIKIARTIADLEESENIVKNHLSEALQYRFRVEN